MTQMYNAIKELQFLKKYLSLFFLLAPYYLLINWLQLEVNAIHTISPFNKHGYFYYYNS